MAYGTFLQILFRTADCITNLIFKYMHKHFLWQNLNQYIQYESTLYEILETRTKVNPARP